MTPLAPGTETVPPPRGGAPWTLLAAGLAALDLSLHLFRNWVAFDEGSMGLAARLVRGGAWPHADFTDTYSGGLALLDAGAQWLFGDNLVAMRIPFGIATILWVGLLAACLRRFVAPAPAAGLALLGYLIGPPAYTAAMPSWYMLYLATAVIWCLLRWDETEDLRWWGAAGVLIGLALFVKINALFLLAGAGSVLLFDERLRSGWLGVLVIGLGVAGAAGVVLAGWPGNQASALILPLVALFATATWHRYRRPGGPPADRGAALRASAWLALGLATIVVPWITAYALHGGLDRLYAGLFVIPFRRSAFASWVSLPFWAPDLLAAGALAALLLVRWSPRRAAVLATLVVAGALFVTESARNDPDRLVLAVWRELRVWGVMALLLVAVVRGREPGPVARPVMIAGWVAAWFALLQFPFAAPNYLAYVAPLLLLAGVAAASPTVDRAIGAALACGLAVWSMGVDHGQPLSLLGLHHQAPPPPLARLDLPHGGLRVPEEDVQVLTGVVAVLDRWGARTIVAGPDAPEVYYLSGRPFADREFFEFMAPMWSAQVLAHRIEKRRPDAVVLNYYPYFSRIRVDSVPGLLSARPVADTTIGPFRLLRLRGPAPAR